MNGRLIAGAIAILAAAAGAVLLLRPDWVPVPAALAPLLTPEARSATPAAPPAPTPATLFQDRAPSSPATAGSRAASGPPTAEAPIAPALYPPSARRADDPRASRMMVAPSPDLPPGTGPATRLAGFGEEAEGKSSWGNAGGPLLTSVASTLTAREKSRVKAYLESGLGVWDACRKAGLLARCQQAQRDCQANPACSPAPR